MRPVAFLLAATMLATPALAAPKVVASIMPVHSIVAAVMGEAGTPELLLSGKLSEHTASFSPSQISLLGKADLVFIIGHGLEAKLAQIGSSETVGGKDFVELSEAPGVRTYPVRQGGGWEEDEHENEGEEAGHDEHAEGILAFDPHVWLDPGNAKAMALEIASGLSKADPANAATYQANAARFAAEIDRLSAEIASGLAPVKNKPFIVFHDAYQYFDKYFGLNGVGSISDVSATSPSAQRLKEIRDKLTASGAACVFREPQFDDKYVQTIIEDTPAKSGVLDGLGADLEPGPAAYPRLLRNLAANLEACLDD